MCLDDVGVIELTQDLYLPQAHEGHAVLAHPPHAYLLDGQCSVRTLGGRLVHHSVGTLA